MISTEEKDKLLSYIMQHIRFPRTYVDFGEAEEQLGFGPSTVVPIVLQLERMQLVGSIRQTGCDISFKHHAGLDDFARRGGFHAQEVFLDAELKKLVLEINALSAQVDPPIWEKINRILEGAASVSQVVSTVSALL